MADIKVGSNDGQSTDDVYTRYKFNRTMPNLPIITIKDKILRTIEENPVVILDGATGSGKSTQVNFNIFKPLNVHITKNTNNF